MATEERRTGGGNGFLYFVVGALVVGVAVLAWMMLSDQPANNSDPLSRAAESVSEAAESISESAEDAANTMPQTAPAPEPAPAPQ